MIIGSSNDYCGVYNDGNDADGAPIASGPIWLGYYRSENSGASFQSSLVPGYPGDTSPYAALAHIRTASSGDPVIAWDGHGRVFMGSESSDDPAGSKKTFGDVWVARFDNPDGETGNTLNDGKRFLGSEVVAKGSSAPNLLGKFHDKTAIEADRTDGRCDGSVYFAWARFTGVGISNIYFSRSVDHGATWSKPMNLTPREGNLQDPDISVTGNGNVYVTYDVGEMQNGQPNGVEIVKSTDCGKTFGPSTLVTTYVPYNAQDVSTSGGSARDCGDFVERLPIGLHVLSARHVDALNRRSVRRRSTSGSTLSTTRPSPAPKSIPARRMDLSGPAAAASPARTSFATTALPARTPCRS